MAYTNSSTSRVRVEALDYLRGVAAFGILAYHMHLFSIGETDASQVLAKVKIYGVSIFYILSGLTLFIVYGRRLSIDKMDLLDFYIKRFFRIVPLLWLVTILTVLLEGGDFFQRKAILNLMVLPGMIKPENMLANGAWSIGNELFFYLVFPILIYLIRLKKKHVILVALVGIIPFCYFTFYKLSQTTSLALQWDIYVNPFNQILYFIVGIFIGFMFDPERLKRSSLWILAIALAVVLFFPVEGEPIVLVTGLTRILLTALIALSCFLFYKSDFTFLPKLITNGLKILGEISYSLYLLHPVVYLVFKNGFGYYNIHSNFVLISSTVLASLIVSYINYQYFEKYFIDLGKVVIKKLSKQPL